MDRTTDDVAKALTKDRGEWLEDVLAGLLAAGVPQVDIEVQEHPSNVTRVAVRGEVKYEWRVDRLKSLSFPVVVTTPSI